jgi:hypothetical protein
MKEFTGDVIGGIKAMFGGGGAPDSKPAAQAADVFIFTCLTTVELPLMRSYIADNAGGAKVAVAWNLELDTLRGDLGLPGWPPKSLHFEFLSQMKPAFYLRPRDYSKSVSVAPFIINYSGALFREYPGPWQVRRAARRGAARRALVRAAAFAAQRAALGRPQLPAPPRRSAQLLRPPVPRSPAPPPPCPATPAPPPR